MAEDIAIVMGVATMLVAAITTAVVHLRSRAFDQRYGANPDSR